MSYPLFLSSAEDPAVRNFRLAAGLVAKRFPNCRLPADGVCRDLDAFIEGLNALVVRHLKNALTGKIPAASARDFVKDDGYIPNHLEMLRLGMWVMDGKPGLALARGPKPDDVAVLRTVAVAAAELHVADRIRTSQGISAKPSAITGEHLTRTRLSRRWKVMFGETTTHSNFRRRMGTAIRYLEAYLADLTTIKIITSASQKRIRSPHLERTLKALQSDSGRA